MISSIRHRTNYVGVPRHLVTAQRQIKVASLFEAMSQDDTVEHAETIGSAYLKDGSFWVYPLSHIFGFDSIFSSELIEAIHTTPSLPNLPVDSWGSLFPLSGFHADDL